MTIQSSNLIKRLTCCALRLAVLTSIVSTLPMVADGQDSHSKNTQEKSDPPKLVQLVRDATRQYINVNNATAAGYGPFLGCVNGPDHGAMGIHYVNGALVGDGLVDAAHPEALIYEPSDGKLTLVGVEYIVDATTWLASHSAPPVLEGQVFNYVASPNRFNIPSFFELHVWAWRDNPQGSFVDWNNSVSCKGM
jgi:hypothetical protein